MDGRVGAESESLRSDSKKRSMDECVDQDQLEGSSKRVKMRDLELVFLSEGTGRNGKLLLSKDSKDQCDDTSRNEEGGSRDTEDTAETVSDAYESVPKARDSLSLLGDAAFLSLRCGDTSSNSADANSKAEISSAHVETSGKTSFLSKPERDATIGFPSSRALQRSKKRVQAVIETELPFLISKEFSYNQVNDPNVIQSSKALSSANGEMHRANWTDQIL
ncbi:hypothetical protein Syun_000063 [Stephania yunnanensis]|uniref:Uncharacterized protein n=1 Tax=Stephania yunnanensis TaxID=152371 RepID=A0AAP0LB96_9MAGN